MKLSLLEFIECRKCHSEFEVIYFDSKSDVSSGKEIESGVLRCTFCQQLVLIVRGIPRFVPVTYFDSAIFINRYREALEKIGFSLDSSDVLEVLSIAENALKKQDDVLWKKQVESEGHSSDQQRINQDNVSVFGNEWVTFDRHGFDDNYYNDEFESRVFHEKTLFRSSELKGKTVLDAGSGNGRYSFQALKHGAEVFSVDLGPGIESTRKNVSSFSSSAHQIQANLFELPFKEGVFDYAFSIGVIHHTGDAFRAFSEIVKRVKKGVGVVGLTCYHKGNIIWETVDWLMRKVTVPMSEERLLSFSRFLAKTCSWVPAFIEKPLNLIFRWEPNVSIMYDWYGAPIATHHTYPEVYNWCNQIGLKLVEDLRWEKKEWIRNIKFIRKYIAPDWAATVRGVRLDSDKILTSQNPKHIFDKPCQDWN